MIEEITLVNIVKCIYHAMKKLYLKEATEMAFIM